MLWLSGVQVILNTKKQVGDGNVLRGYRFVRISRKILTLPTRKRNQGTWLKVLQAARVSLQEAAVLRVASAGALLCLCVYLPPSLVSLSSSWLNPVIIHLHMNQQQHGPQAQK